MISVEAALAIFGFIIFAGFFATLLFERKKIPDVLILLLVGLCIGPILRIVNPQDFIPLASIIGTLALIVVLFDGGLHLDLFEILTQIPNAAFFSLLVFVLGALLVGGLLHFVLGWPLIHSLLLGVIAGGTGSNEVLPIVQRTSASGKTKVLLSLDALINDVLTFVFIFAILEVYATGSVNVESAASKIASTFAIGVMAGVLAGLFWLEILRKLRGKALGYMVTLGFLFVLYAGINYLGGSGAIAVLFFSLVLGNADFIWDLLRWKERFKLDPSISTTHKEVSFFVRTFYFVYLGILFKLEFFSSGLLIVASVAMLGFFVARYIGALVLNRLESSFRRYTLLISTMLPRGLISTVVLFLPSEKGIVIPNLVEVVFLLVLLSNVITIAGSFAFERRNGVKIPESKLSKRPKIVKMIGKKP